MTIVIDWKQQTFIRQPGKGKREILVLILHIKVAYYLEVKLLWAGQRSTERSRRSLTRPGYANQ
ncbi:MAG: hypothetical protein ACYTXY_35175, partial [Nostoc sp.]